MLGAFRRCRFLALLALALSPGSAGVVLPALSPCPMEAPWLADRGMAAGGHDPHCDHASPEHRHDARCCHCIGACCTSAFTVVPRLAAGGTLVAEPAHHAATRVPPAAPPVRRPADFLPPTTAPPLVG